MANQKPDPHDLISEVFAERKHILNEMWQRYREASTDEDKIASLNAWFEVASNPPNFQMILEATRD